MEFKNFKIKKGNHHSGFYPNIHLGLSSISYEVLFTESCLYKFNDIDDYDVNKLFGISFGLHHKNSARFGWNVDGSKIKIFAYCYKLGVRYIRDIASLPIDKIHIFQINVYKAYYEFKITDFDGNVLGWTNITKAQGTKKWGYKLFPYFGGNKPAPQDITIKMKKR